jgi:hypothetical protein
MEDQQLDGAANPQETPAEPAHLPRAVQRRPPLPPGRATSATTRRVIPLSEQPPAARERAAHVMLTQMLAPTTPVSTRDECERDLITLGAAALGPLREALASEQRFYMRLRIVRVTGCIGGPEALDLLRHVCAEDAHDSVRRMAWTELGRLGEEPTPPTPFPLREGGDGSEASSPAGGEEPTPRTLFPKREGGDGSEASSRTGEEDAAAAAAETSRASMSLPETPVESGAATITPVVTPVELLATSILAESADVAPSAASEAATLPAQPPLVALADSCAGAEAAASATTTAAPAPAVMAAGDAMEAVSAIIDAVSHLDEDQLPIWERDTLPISAVLVQRLATDPRLAAVTPKALAEAVADAAATATASPGSGAPASAAPTRRRLLRWLLRWIRFWRRQGIMARPASPDGPPASLSEISIAGKG